MGSAKQEASDHKLCIQHRQGKKAMSILVERHGGWARKYAYRFSRQEQCCQKDDLFQEARRGLIDAAEHFDPKRGAFTTCASIWIKKRCLAFIDKAKQFGAQSDSLNQVVEGEGPERDYSFLMPHFGRIMKLYHSGVISQTDKEIMRAIISPLDQQEEILKPVWARWWRDAKKRTMQRMAKNLKAFQTKRKGKIKGVVEVQSDMFGR